MIRLLLSLLFFSSINLLCNSTTLIPYPVIISDLYMNCSKKDAFKYSLMEGFSTQSMGLTWPLHSFCDSDSLQPKNNKKTIQWGKRIGSMLASFSFVSVLTYCGALIAKNDVGFFTPLWKYKFNILTKKQTASILIGAALCPMYSLLLEKLKVISPVTIYPQGWAEKIHQNNPQDVMPEDTEA